MLEVVHFRVTLERQQSKISFSLSRKYWRKVMGERRIRCCSDPIAWKSIPLQHYSFDREIQYLHGVKWSMKLSSHTIGRRRQTSERERIYSKLPSIVSGNFSLFFSSSRSHQRFPSRWSSYINRSNILLREKEKKFISRPLCVRHRNSIRFVFSSSSRSNIKLYTYAYSRRSIINEEKWVYVTCV